MELRDRANLASIDYTVLNDLFERKESSADKNFFVMKAKNHQVIGKSQFYASASSMENGIQSVMKNGPTTEIDDLS